MMTRRMLLLAAGASAWATALPAQARRLPEVGETGSVGDIVVVGTREGCAARAGAATGAATGAVRIRRRGQPEILVRAGQSQRVLLGDEYRVERGTDVRIRIESDELGRGAFTLAPQLLCPVRGADRTFRPYGVVDTARYEIDRAADGALQLGVRSGGAFVQWYDRTGRRLVVVAGGHLATVPGTEFGVATDAATGAAAFYVVEGRVRFERAGGAVAGAGQLFQLTGEPAAARSAQSTVTAALRSAAADVEFHRALFPPPAPPTRPPGGSLRSSLLRSPWLYVATAAVATGGYCGLVSDDKCGLSSSPSGRRRGVVRVEIPL